MRVEKMRVLGGHMVSMYSEAAAGDQGRLIACVLVRQGVFVSAVCNAALQCHVCHPSPLLSGTAAGPSTESDATASCSTPRLGKLYSELQRKA